MISIIVPVYNTKQYLTDAISDILSQTYKDFEVIFVDNGSDDGSREILISAAEKDDRIRIIDCEKKGAGAARNLGIKAATGEYIQFLDSDDRFDECLLEKAVERAERCRADILIFDVQCFRDEDGMEMFSEWFIRRDKLPGKEVFSWKDCPDTIFNLSYSVVWNKLIRKDLIDRTSVLFEDIPYGNDIYFIHCLMLEAERITFLDTPLVRYRQERQGALTTTQQRKEDPFCLVNVMKRFFMWLKGNDYLEYVKISFLNYAALCFTGGLESLDSEGFFMVYPEAKKVLFEEFGLSPELIDLRDPDIREKIDRMKDSEAGEYLFRLMKSYSSQSFERLTWALDEQRLNEIMKNNKVWHFDSSRIPDGGRVILYGYGDVGKDYYMQLKDNKDIKEIIIVDKDYENYRERDVRVYSPERIRTLEYDTILITVGNPDIASDIKDSLEKEGIPESRIVWMDPFGTEDQGEA